VSSISYNVTLPRTQDAPAAHPVVHPGQRPVRALIAARLSKLQRGGQQGIGIDTQDEKSRAFCEREGMTVIHVVADTKSGTVAPWDRKNLKPWVTESEKMAMYDAVVAYKTDRWSRGTQEDFTRIEFWATQNGKRLIDARRFRLANEALAGREKRGPRGEPQTRAMLKGAIKCPDCEGSSMNKLTCRASSKHGGGTYTYYRCTGTGSRRKGCGNMVRMEVADAAVDEIMATTFRVRVKRLILVKGTDYQDQLEEISYRIRALDPDVMSDEQFDEQVRRLRAERDRLKALPAEPDRWEEQLTGELYADIYQALPVSERGAWLTSHGFLVHATKKEVSVIQGDVRGTAHLG
jgi:hypothetical protein